MMRDGDVLISSGSEFLAEDQQQKRNDSQTLFLISAGYDGCVLPGEVLSAAGPPWCWRRIVACMSAHVQCLVYEQAKFVLHSLRNATCPSEITSRGRTSSHRRRKVFESGMAHVTILVLFVILFCYSMAVPLSLSNTRTPLKCALCACPCVVVRTGVYLNSDAHFSFSDTLTFLYRLEV